MTSMGRNQPERRRARRRQTIGDHGIVSVRIRPGRAVALIDVSVAGALVESPQQLMPGSPVELQLSTDERQTVIRGRVLRCSVAGLHAAGIRYRGAVGFENHLPWFVDDLEGGYPVPGAEARLHRSSGADVSHQLV